MTLCAYRRRRQILTLAVCFDFMVVRIYHGCVYTLMTFNWLFVPLSVFSLLKRFYPKPFLSQFTNVVRKQQQKQPSLFIFALFVLVFSDLQNCYVLLPASWSINFTMCRTTPTAKVPVTEKLFIIVGKRMEVMTASSANGCICRQISHLHLWQVIRQNPDYSQYYTILNMDN